MEERVLTIKERAYIIDKIANTSYFEEEFGPINKETEEQIISSIFRKLELTYYLY